MFESTAKMADRAQKQLLPTIEKEQVEKTTCPKIMNRIKNE